MIHQGDCVEVMAAMDAGSIDAIVTDPPYGLEFMGKEWDRLGVEPMRKITSDEPRPPGNPWQKEASSYGYGKHPDVMQQWHTRWATEALRVAKPGAYLLAFGGTRTVHRLTVALEDAGWIIRDLLVWGYASGFPKSQASLKPAWEPIVLARKPGPLAKLRVDECRIGTADGHGGGAKATSGFANGYERGDGFTPSDSGRWPANIVLTDAIFDGGWDGVVGGGEARSSGIYQRGAPGPRLGPASIPLSGGDPYCDTGTYSRFFQLQETDGCYLCGDAKPAEPSSSPPSPSGASALGHAPTSRDGTTESMATDGRAPRTNGVASTTANTEPPSLSEDAANTPSTLRSKPLATSPASAPESSPAKSQDATGRATGITMTTTGRWMCATCVEAITCDYTGGSPLRAFIIPKASRKDREPDVPGLPSTLDGGVWGGDEDDLSDGKKRTIARQNTHPTVKPTALMRHLIRLVTPQGGTLLDPFLGSGTTAKAAVLEGVQWVGIEREPEYIRIAEQRLVGLEPEPTQMEMTA